jgi:hypothetical protein
VRPDTVVDVPVPVVMPPPGDAVSVHEPEAGNPVSSTLPVLVTQVGAVMVLTVGAAIAVTTTVPTFRRVEL